MAATEITTVSGRIAAHDLGPTLMHEHLYCDISAQSGKQDNVLTDTTLMARELARFSAAGGRSIVEMTPVGLGRDPRKLHQLSEASGVHIISGVAFYTEDTYPEWMQTASLAGIADYLVGQIEQGSEGVPAGLIGELASHNEDHADAEAYRLSEAECTVFAAAAEAQRRTGAAIYTHAALGRGGLAQLDTLEAAGADLNRIVVGHCDAQVHRDPEKDLRYCETILRRGAFCGFDLVGWEELVPDSARAARLVELLGRGHAGGIVLGTDTCRQSHLAANGGRGLDFLWRSFLPRLRSLGATPEQLEKMLQTAPRSLLSR
jgi:phosphotriesterase-related protein